MRHYGNTSLGNIMPNLPAPCRKQMEAIQDKGWTCAFYLSVYNDKLHYGMAASKGIEQRIVCAADIEAVVDTLFARTADAGDET